MNKLRNIACVLLLVCNVGLFFVGPTVFGPEDQRFTVLGSSKKQFIITYRVDEGNKRGKAKKAIITAESQSEAKELFREEFPDAVIISCTEKTK